MLYGGETIPDDDDDDGIVYMLAKGCTGTITINKDVKIKQEDSSTPLNNVTLLCSEDGDVNLQIKDLNIVNTENTSIIRFNGSGNTLTFSGTSKLVQKDATNFDRAVINVGNGLTLEDGGSGTLDISCEGTNQTSTAIGVDCYTSGGTNGGAYGWMVDSYIIVNSGNYILNVDKGGGGIGMSDNAHIYGNIEILGGNITATANYGSAIGCGSGMMTGDLIIGSAVINATSVYGAGVGAGSYDNRRDAGDWLDGNITIGDGAKITATSTNGGGIGAGQGACVDNPGYVYISERADISATGARTSLYTKYDKEFYGGINTEWWRPNGTIQGVEFRDSIPVDSPPEPPELPEESYTYEGNPLWIQHGTQSGQRIHVYINSMQTKDIGLDGIEVTTRDKALDAIAKVESALEYALNEATNMGAYLQRLDYTDSNVTTMGENVQNAESVIRDVDMAKEMTEYTKYNILTQSSQAMLAQANQNGSAILSLLQ